MSKIILIRHAKVKINIRTVFAKEVGNFIKEYNEADIEKDLPMNLPEADIYIGSTLKRSIASIKMLGKEADIVNACFNEADLPYANWKLIKMPVTIWAVIFRIAWLFGYCKHSESYSNAKKRAVLAADLLMKHHENNKSVILVGHEIMNRLILRVLMSRGYNLITKTGSANWDYAVVSKQRSRN